MRRVYTISILVVLLLVGGEARSCQCDMFNCDMAERTPVSGRVVKITKKDGRVLKKEDNLMSAGDDLIWFGVPEHIADFEVLSSDNTVLIGKIIKIKAGGGTSCDASISYGLVHFDLYQIKNNSGKLMASVGSCTPKKYFSDIKALEAHFSKRLEVKQRCKVELVRRDSIYEFAEKERRRLTFTPIVQLEGGWEMRGEIEAKWDSVSNNLRDIIPVSNTTYSYRLYMTIYVLPSGEVFNVDIIKGAEAVEPYYELFIQEIKKKTSFPRIKSNVGEGFEPYKVTMPLNLGNTY